jgi:hypothetical protein
MGLPCKKRVGEKKPKVAGVNRPEKVFDGEALEVRC